MTQGTFEVNGHSYRAGRLDVFQQNHVARKFGSVLIFLGSMTTGSEARTPKNAARAIVATSSPLSVEDVDYAIGACLSVVTRQQQGGAWAPVRAPNGALMFPDIELRELLEIVWNVLEQHRLVDFFFDGPPGSSAPGAASL